MTSNLSLAQQFDPLFNGVPSGVSEIFDRQLGPPARVGQPSPYEAKSYNRVNMLAEYERQTQMLRDTIVDYTLTGDYDWMTQFILPVFYTDQIEFAWTQWEVNPFYLGLVPHLSNSNVITMERKLRTASIVRRGITYEFEDDYITTVGGRASVQAAIDCISNAVRENFNVEGIRALRSCHGFEVELARQYGVYNVEDLDEHLDRFCERFMIVQKTDFGINRLDEIVAADQEKVGGLSNAWILGREVQAYCQVVDPLTTIYSNGGQEAVDRVHGRPVGRPAIGNTMGNIRSVAPTLTVRNSNVFIAKSHYRDGIRQADLLTRTVEIGVYNLMVDRTMDYTTYRPATRNIRIYDEKNDDWHVMEFGEALRNLPIWDENTGELKNVFVDNGRSNTTSKLKTDTTDFLSYPLAGNTRKNIEYVGQMNKAWMKPEHFFNGAQTLLNAISYGDAATARKLLAAHDAVNNVNDANVASLYSRLENIVGKDSIFTQVDSATFYEDLYVNTNSLGIRPNSLLIGSKTTSQVDDSEVKTQRWLNAIICHPIPDEHKARTTAIVNDSKTHWRERANMIKAIITDILKQNPQAISAFSDPKTLDEWYDTRVTNFAKEMEKAATTKTTASVPKGQLASLIGLGLKQGPGSRGAPMVAVQETEGQSALRSNLNAIWEQSQPRLLKILALVYAGIRFNRDRLAAIHQAGVAVPLGIMLARPHCGYHSRYGIKVATGGVVGFTGMGHSSTQVGHDAGKRCGFLNFVTYIGPVVMEPRHVVVCPDIYITKYLGGMGVEFWKPEDYKRHQPRRMADIIAIPLPPTVKKLDKRIDIRGFWYTMMQQKFITQDRFEKQLYPGAARIIHLFGLDPTTTGAHARNGVTNYWMSQGVEFYLNPITGAWDSFTVEQSPFGNKVYPGCGAARKGQLKHLETPTYLLGH